MIVSTLLYVVFAVLLGCVALLSWWIMSSSFCVQSRRNIGTGLIVSGIISITTVVGDYLSGNYGVIELALMLLMLAMVTMIGLILTS